MWKSITLRTSIRFSQSILDYSATVIYEKVVQICYAWIDNYFKNAKLPQFTSPQSVS